VTVRLVDAARVLARYMSREPDSRVPVTVRLSPDGLAKIDALAAEEERDRSAMVRLLLREALEARSRKAVEGWQKLAPRR
jgi:hypothetical protein